VDRLLESKRDRIRHPEPFARDQWVRAMAATLPPESRVLDVGAGASKYRPLFSHCRYESQDFCRYEGPLVQYLAPIDYVCDLTSIPLPDGSLDAVLCTEVIEHIVEPTRALGELSRLLKPGGRLFVSAPLLSWLHMEPYHYYGGFTHYWYRHWLPKFGLAIDSITPVGGPGTSCAAMCEAFYAEWSRAERNLRPLRRALSLAVRKPAAVVVRYVFPRILPKFDRWLGAETICSGYLVAATKAQ
jgi:SAM-dependent methyltransferase